jgi:hypothetical protein
MVGRAFIEALKFGAPGGAVLGLGLALMPTGPGEVNVFSGGFFPGLIVTLIGSLIGVLFAYPSLIVGSIAADLARRWVGAFAALLVTVVGLELWFSWLSDRDWSSPWTALPLGIAAYAAVVAWFRIPRILGR